MTNEFLVRYATGLEQVIHSTCASIEHFCNEHFGSTWGEAQANGASVVMANADGSYGEPKGGTSDPSAAVEGVAYVVTPKFSPDAPSVSLIDGVPYLVKPEPQ